MLENFRQLAQEGDDLHHHLLRLPVDLPARLPFARADAAGLIGRLGDAHGWVRDTAQRLLVERGDRSILPALVAMTLTSLMVRGGRPLADWARRGVAKRDLRRSRRRMAF